MARGTRRVVDAVSFSVPEGSALLLTGPNGAGKTTLIRTIAGFLRLASGSLELQCGDEERTLPEQCHYVGHQNGLKPNLTVAENVMFWGEYLGGTPLSPDKCAAALEAFELTSLAHIATGYLSAGQKRRAGLARLMAAERRIWLLDEPTVSLDAASTEILAKRIKSHLKAGGIVLAATHIDLGLDGVKELRMQPPAPRALQNAFL